MWRAPARRLIKKHLAAGVQKTDDENYRCLSDGIFFFFSGWVMTVGRRGQPFAPWTMDAHDIFEAVTYIH